MKLTEFPEIQSPYSQEKNPNASTGPLVSQSHWHCGCSTTAYLLDIEHETLSMVCWPQDFTVRSFVATTAPESLITTCHSLWKAGLWMWPSSWCGPIPWWNLAYMSGLGLNSGLEHKFSWLYCWKEQISMRKITEIHDGHSKGVGWP